MSQRGGTLARCRGAWAARAGLLFAALGVCGCAAVELPVGDPVRAGDARVVAGRSPGPDQSEVGLASWYGEPHHGQPTASGEIFDMEQLTAAHRTLPFGTRLRVVNLENGRIVQVRVNDRGPYLDGRVLDLSRGAARALAMVERGVVPVRWEIIRK